MLMTILNVIYLLVAIAIIALVLMQRGTGAAAGSGFGAGASGTVFGARGSSNFLSKSTKWLGVAFFAISLFMAWYASHGARPATTENLGVMATQEAAPAPVRAPASGEMPVAPQPVQAAPADATVPAVPAEQKQPSTTPSAPPQGD